MVFEINQAKGNSLNQYERLKAEDMLAYSKGISGGDIRVSVSGVRGNMSWAEFNFSGNMVCECNRGTFLFPGLTKEEIDSALENIKSMCPAPYNNVYLRFGELPKGGRSKNYATGMMEDGVSCYALCWDLMSQSYKRTGGGLDGAVIVYMAQGAPMYLISGEESGTGSDGEPLLKNAKIMARLKFDSEKDGYVIK